MDIQKIIQDEISRMQQDGEIERVIREKVRDIIAAAIDSALENRSVLRGQSLTELKLSRPNSGTEAKSYKPNLTIKQMIVEVLKLRNSATGFEILTELNVLFKKSIPRTSASPQMSRLLAAGVIRKEGKLYSLTEKGDMYND